MGTAARPTTLRLQMFDRRALDALDAAVLAVDERLVITWTNRGWARAADANGAPELAAVIGWSLLDAIRPVDRAGERRFLEACLRSGQTAHRTYDCDSPTQRREFRMTAYALEDGLLMLHTPTRRVPWERWRTEGDDDSLGRLYTLCAGCQRIELSPASWVWAAPPAVLPRNVSGGICPPCFHDRFSRVHPPGAA